MVTGAYNPHTFKVGRDGIGKQTNKNDFDFNQGKNGKKKKKQKEKRNKNIWKQKGALKKSSNKWLLTVSTNELKLSFKRNEKNWFLKSLMLLKGFLW